MRSNPGIVSYAFENMLRDMAVDTQPLSARLWSSFYESVVNEDIANQLSKPVQQQLNEFSEYHFSVPFHELNSELVYGAIGRLDESTASRAFAWLMRIKDKVIAESTASIGAHS